MVPSRGSVWAPAALAAGALSLILVLWHLGGGRMGLSRPGFVPTASLRSGIVLKEGNVLVNSFRTVESDAAFDLEVGWKDFRRASWFVEFSVSKLDLAEAQSDFGFTGTERDAALKEPLEALERKKIAELRAYVSGVVAKSRYRRYIRLVDRGPLSFSLGLEKPPEDEAEAVRKEFRRIAAAMAKEQTRLDKSQEKDVTRLYEAFLETRGIRLKDGEMSVAYGLCASRGRVRTRPILESFRAIASDLSLYDFLALLVAYLQEVPFVKPPLVEGERTILGYWVPTRVFIENGGDCDSKGVTLAALWRNFKNSPIVLFKVPDHLFVGLAVPSPATEGTILFGGLRYTLCEVTGTELLPPGYISSYSRMYLESGRYAYERID